MRSGREPAAASVVSLCPIRQAICEPADALKAIEYTLKDLEADAFAARLRTHKLKGDLADCWAFSAGYDLRLVFQFVQSDGLEAILLLSVGTHDEVY